MPDRNSHMMSKTQRSFARLSLDELKIEDLSSHKIDQNSDLKSENSKTKRDSIDFDFKRAVNSNLKNN